MDLDKILPKPKNTHNQQGYLEEQEYYNLKGNKKNVQPEIVIKTIKHIPEYGKRKGYQPKEPEDFGDGGAFPEIHIPQYPLNMGNKKKSSMQSSAMVSTNSNSLSVINGNNSNTKSMVISNSQYKDLLPKNFTESELARPDEDEIKETFDRTKEAVEKRLGVKLKVNRTTPNFNDKDMTSSTLVNYTPASGDNITRTIKLIEQQYDPMEPPKFKIKKQKNRPRSPPPPLMHSPPKKLTIEEKKEWTIPPCVSNYRNNSGFAISLDKRQAADGRNLQHVDVSENFAHFAQSLYVAAEKSREELNARADMEKKILMKEKEKKQDELRKLAEDVRNERAGIINNSSNSNSSNKNNTSSSGGNYNNQSVKRHRDEGDDGEKERRKYSSSESESSDSDSDSSDSSDESDDDGKRNRDRIRKEKKKERERKYRLEVSGKKSKYSRDQDRDISEKIALGQGGSNRTEDSIYDQRLFNQSESISSGFGDDEAYNVYSKPLFGGSVSSSIYRPRINQEEENSVDDILSNSRFENGKGVFTGGNESSNKSNNNNNNSNARSGPVQFEHEKRKPKTDDPFKMDEFMDEAKGKRNK